MAIISNTRSLFGEVAGVPPGWGCGMPKMVGGLGRNRITLESIYGSVRPPNQSFGQIERYLIDCMQIVKIR